MKSRIILIIAIWVTKLSTAFATLQWPMTVTNISELQSLHLADVIGAETAYTTSTRPAVYVLGYYNPGDRGGGMFEWDPNSSSATDGGLYFTTNGWVSGNGRWVRRVNGETLNVKMWGATGDGTTDDAPAVQKALNALTSGSTIYFPAGVYKLNATVNTKDQYSQHYALMLTNINITIRGDGPGSVLYQTDFKTTLLAAQFNTKVAGLTIENLKFQADTNNLYTAPTLDYTSGTLFTCQGTLANGWSKYLRLKNLTTDDQGKRYAFQIGGMDDVIIDSCHFTHFATTNGNMGPGTATIFIAADGVGTFSLINNYFNGGTTSTNPPYGADGLVYQQNGEQTVVSGNIINDYKLEAIQCGAEKQTISGNIFRASWYGAIPLALTIQRTNAQLTLVNNVQTGGGSFAGNAGTASNTNVTIDVTIANNTVMLGDKAAGTYGSVVLGFWQLRRAIITGNTFDNYTDQGAILSGTGTDDSSLLVQGNSFTSMSPLPGAGVGLHLGANFRNISVLNNTISAQGNGSIVVDGTFNAPTNLPGRVVVGNNIYVAMDNATPAKWIRVGGVTVTTATTNAGNYVVSDLNPGAF